jgi:uncharacterized protein YpbB
VVSGMLYIEYIILFCLKKLNGERTIYSIYHLLKGKKSSQTIQDVHLFELVEFFGIYEPLTRETLDEIVKKALKHKWISKCENKRFLLTSLGEEILTINSEKLALNYINGWSNHSIVQPFWERLTLLIQVISNLVFQETHYIPIQKNRQVHTWIKGFLRTNQLKRINLGNALFLELVDCLERTEEIDPSVIIFRLSGYNRIGLTSEQTAEKLKMEFSQYHFEFLNVLHYLIQKVKEDLNSYPILSSLISDSKVQGILTNSTQMTFKLVKKGYSMEEIAIKRRLKMSTIEDHIVEIALNIEGFSIDPFIDQGVQKKIISVARKSATKQLKVIKSNVVSANYFEIRLVLAKYGVKKWN